MIGKVIFILLAALSSIAAVMVVNFWYEWLKPFEAPHATYDGEPPAENQSGVGEPARATNPMRVQIWSSGTFSVAVVEVQARTKESAPWKPLFQISNPNAEGELWSLPPGLECRAVTTAFVQGDLHAEFQVLKEKS